MQNMIIRFSIVFFLLFFFGCNRQSIEPVPCGIVRFDRMLFSLDHESPDIVLIDSVNRAFFQLYAAGVLQLGDLSGPDFSELLSYFLMDTTMNEIYDTVSVVYPNLKNQEKELSEAFGYYKHYFPDILIPRIYSHISGFNQSIIVDSNMVGIGLDNYLGADCIFYKMLATPVPVYIQRRMTPAHIVRDVLFGWLTTEHPYRPLQKDLISGMIYQGKICYLMEKLLPEYSRERIFNFTKEQLEWCENSEFEIWNFLIEEEHLFKTDQLLLLKYLNEAPFTSGMPVESPGKTVVWTGRQIVEKYVKNTDTGLEELMKEQDFHKILRQAKYMPG